jgi:hypothetical protein
MQEDRFTKESYHFHHLLYTIKRWEPARLALALDSAFSTIAPTDIVLLKGWNECYNLHIIALSLRNAWSSEPIKNVEHAFYGPELT